jgi:hypothetical protein
MTGRAKGDFTDVVPSFAIQCTDEEVTTNATLFSAIGGVGAKGGASPAMCGGDEFF